MRVDYFVENCVEYVKYIEQSFDKKDLVSVNRFISRFIKYLEAERDVNSFISYNVDTNYVENNQSAKE